MTADEATRLWERLDEMRTSIYAENLTINQRIGKVETRIANIEGKLNLLIAIILGVTPALVGAAFSIGWALANS